MDPDADTAPADDTGTASKPPGKRASARKAPAAPEAEAEVLPGREEAPAPGDAAETVDQQRRLRELQARTRAEREQQGRLREREQRRRH